MSRVLAALLASIAVLVVGCSSPAASVAPTTALVVPPSGTRVSVADAWARLGAKGAGSAAYLTIAGGATADALTGASTTAATEAQVHETSTDAQGLTGMHPVDAVPIPAGAKVAFEPGGYHIMLNGLTQDLRPGDTFPLVLTFEGAGELTVPVEVRGS